MAALPYIQLYIADYLADTMHLQAEEHGAYLLLIFNYWQTAKPIPKSRLQLIARVSSERWTDVERTLNEFFNDTGTHWQHDRIDADLAKVESKQDQAVKAGKASAAARNKQKSNGEPTSVPTDVQPPVPTDDGVPLERKGNHTDTDTDTDKKNRRGSRLPVDWEITEHWKTEAMRVRPDWHDQHVQRIADGFRDYWVSKPGGGAIKTDWLATWRNWCRNDKSPVYPLPAQPLAPGSPQPGMRKIKMMPIPGRDTGAAHG